MPSTKEPARRARAHPDRPEGTRAPAADRSPWRRSREAAARGGRAREVVRRVMLLDAILTEHPLLVSEHVPWEHEEARLAEELARTTRHDASAALAALVDVDVVVLD